MKKVIVTGATGLLGTNVIIKLLKNGYSVIALVRKESKYLGEENGSLKWVEANLSSDLSQYLKNVDFMIHIAAETRMNLLTYNEYRKVNYEWTVDLFNQAQKCEVKKFLFISSANTLGFGNKADPGSEEKRQKYPFTQSWYAQSKLEAENYLLRNANNTEVIILNPTFMIGAHDSKPSSGKLIFWVWKKKLIFYPKGGKNFVHVEDVANGVVNALEKGKNGEKYLLANENLSYIDFFRIINRVTNQKPIKIPIPNIFLSILGKVGDELRKMKIRTNLSTANMKALQIHNYYSSRKSLEELDVQYQPVDNAVKDAIEYFKSKEMY